MDSNTGFIFKVVIASTVVSIAIKYGGPELPIPATKAIALVAVFTPAAIASGILSWRAYFQRQPKN